MNTETLEYIKQLSEIDTKTIQVLTKHNTEINIIYILLFIILIGYGFVLIYLTIKLGELKDETNTIKSKQSQDCK